VGDRDEARMLADRLVVVAVDGEPWTEQSRHASAGRRDDLHGPELVSAGAVPLVIDQVGDVLVEAAPGVYGQHLHAATHAEHGESGRVRGVKQTCCVLAAGAERVRLDLAMYVGAEDPHDRIVVAGDPPLDVRVLGGFQGDRATVGATVSAAFAVGKMAPGLYKATATSYR